ncbi:TraR/DksA C4-type zinc finger protein [Aeromicrobium sp. NPDC092404]|uniref:TraR/DksA family transcriptional regulator n=1 Tax=Aeromicrobium sp. NPDC092404 TaxID=3154976 RepID=UPI003418DB9E
MTTEIDPTWTTEELSSIREGLLIAADRLRAELLVLGNASAQAVSASTLEVLHDDLDVATHRAELLQDAVQAENTAAILAQTEHVLDRLDQGLYGRCEQCSASIARPRLEAFPRATLCITCVA